MQYSKHCIKCGILKPLTHFYKHDKCKTINRLDPCRVCRRIQVNKDKQLGRRRCSLCRIVKNPNYFPSGNTHSQCSRCLASYSREFASKNKKRIRNYQRERYWKMRTIILLKRRAYARKNVERIKAYRNKYYAENKERLKKIIYHRRQSKEGKRNYKAWYLRVMYGLSIEEFEMKELKQGGKCAICNIKPKRLVVDHNSETGKVRDLLCDTCNTGIGMFREQKNLLENAIKYLDKHTDVKECQA